MQNLDLGMIDIYQTTLKGYARQISIAGGAVYIPPFIIHECFRSINEIMRMNPEGKDMIPLSPATLEYLDYLEKESQKKIDFSPDSQKIKESKNLGLIIIHYRNLTHFENQLIAPNKPDKTPPEIINRLIEQEKESIKSLI